MELALKRMKAWPHSTTGDLLVNGDFQCHTLEDTVRDIAEDGTGKIFGETAIPAGRYKVAWTLSPRLGHFTPRLLDVPHFTGILIHGGNTDANTEGCILVGNQLTDDGRITGGTSTPAVKGLYDLIEGVLAPKDDQGQPVDPTEEVWITITDDFKQAA